MNFEDRNDALFHFGILGMKWGRKSGSDNKIPRSTDRLAKKDAKRFAEAKMFYGETAGTKRKLLKAELEKKKKNIPRYEEAFNSHLEKVDYANAAKKAVRTRVRIDSADKGRRLAKKVLGITGPLSVGVASALYYANKPKVDAFIAYQLNKIMR